MHTRKVVAHRLLFLLLSLIIGCTLTGIACDIFDDDRSMWMIMLGNVARTGNLALVAIVSIIGMRSAGRFLAGLILLAGGLEFLRAGLAAVIGSLYDQPTTVSYVILTLVMAILGLYCGLQVLFAKTRLRDELGNELARVIMPNKG